MHEVALEALYSLYVRHLRLSRKGRLHELGAVAWPQAGRWCLCTSMESVSLAELRGRLMPGPMEQTFNTLAI